MQQMLCTNNKCSINFHTSIEIPACFSSDEQVTAKKSKRGTPLEEEEVGLSKKSLNILRKMMRNSVLDKQDGRNFLGFRLLTIHSLVHEEENF